MRKRIKLEIEKHVYSKFCMEREVINMVILLSSTKWPKKLVVK